MNGNYLKPGIAAITLALLFPIYWSSVFIFGSDGRDFIDVMRQEVQTFSGFDILFLLIGALEIYIYVSLSRAIEAQLNSSATKILLMIMIASVGLLHGLVFVDFYLAIYPLEATSSSIDSVVGTSVVMSISALVVYSIAGLILSVVLLMQSQGNAPMLKYFGILLLIVCLLQITIFLAIFNLILFPVSLIVLAFYFLKDPETLEVI